MHASAATSVEEEGNVWVRPESPISYNCTECRSCSLYSSTLLIPSYVVIISALALILHIALTSRFVRRFSARVRSGPDSPKQTKAEASARGGRLYYAYMVARFAGCVALSGLSIASLVFHGGREFQDDAEVDGAYQGKRDMWLHVAICVTFVRCLF